MKAYLKYNGFTKFTDIPKVVPQLTLITTPPFDFVNMDPSATVEVTKLLFDYSHSEYIDTEEIAVYNYVGSKHRAN